MTIIFFMKFINLYIDSYSLYFLEPIGTCQFIKYYAVQFVVFGSHTDMQNVKVFTQSAFHTKILLKSAHVTP